jgi:hypothetical protein
MKKRFKGRSLKGKDRRKNPKKFQRRLNELKRKFGKLKC